MPDTTVLIKPASGLCNMRCRYCFYYGGEGHSNGIMDDATLELTIKRTLEYAGADGRAHSVSLAFQGGEPTLAGLDYFRKVVALIGKYNLQGHRINYAVQTNGLCIDREMAEFFAENRFLAGVSLDGNREIHDMNRLDASGKATFSRVMKTLRLFDEVGVEYNILCVVSRAVVRRPAAVYDALTGAGFRYLQFIPCLDRNGGGLSPDPESYGKFLCTVFDRWYRDIVSGKSISVRDFDNYILRAAGRLPEICTMRGICGCYFTVESDGSVYPCDFFVLPEWRIGNVADMSFSDMLASDTAKRFITESTAHPEECKKCRYYGFCGSGCRSLRDESGKNIFCLSYKTFLDHAGDRIIELSRRFFGR